MQFKCAQKGCEFDADEAPDNCPVCNHPFVDAGESSADYDALTKDSLIDELKEREISPGDGEPAFSRWTKDELIVALEDDDEAEADELAHCNG